MSDQSGPINPGLSEEMRKQIAANADLAKQHGLPTGQEATFGGRVTKYTGPTDVAPMERTMPVVEAMKLTSEQRAAQVFCLPYFSGKVLDPRTCVEIGKIIDAGIMDSTSHLSDLLETAWGIICNAGGGDWDRESKDWKAAAERFRENYFLSIQKPGPDPNAPRQERHNPTKHKFA